MIIDRKKTKETTPVQTSRIKSELHKNSVHKLVVINEIKLLLGEGYTDLSIIEKLGLEPPEYRSFLDELYKNEQREILKNPINVYIDYKLKIEKAIKEINESIDELKEDEAIQNKHTVLIQAIKLKTDLNEKIFDRAKELGILEAYKKEPGFNDEIDKMTIEDLTKAIFKDLKELQEIQKAASTLDKPLPVDTYQAFGAELAKNENLTAILASDKKRELQELEEERIMRTKKILSIQQKDEIEALLGE